MQRSPVAPTLMLVFGLVIAVLAPLVGLVLLLFTPAAPPFEYVTPSVTVPIDKLDDGPTSITLWSRQADDAMEACTVTAPDGAELEWWRHSTDLFGPKSHTVDDVRYTAWLYVVTDQIGDHTVRCGPIVPSPAVEVHRTSWVPDWRLLAVIAVSATGVVVAVIGIRRLVRR